MLDSRYIYNEANRIVEMAGTWDPIKIAEELGINLLYFSNAKSTLGFYQCMEDVRFIQLNSDLIIL